MGMEVTYRRLKKAKWTRLQKDRKKASAFLFSFLPGLDLNSLSALASDPEALRAKQAEILAAVQKAQDDPARVDLEKDWHALHFLLSRDPSMDPEHLPGDPLHNVVLGGHPTRIKTDYGPVRCLEPEEVRDAARALAKISVKELRHRFSAKAFNDEEIYPNPEPGGWTRKEVESVFQLFPKLVRFFQDAAAAREIVLVYAT
jgi:hypothetical protein